MTFAQLTPNEHASPNEPSVSCNMHDRTARNISCVSLSAPGNAISLTGIIFKYMIRLVHLLKLDTISGRTGRNSNVTQTTTEPYQRCSIPPPHSMLCSLDHAHCFTRHQLGEFALSEADKFLIAPRFNHFTVFYCNYAVRNRDNRRPMRNRHDGHRTSQKTNCASNDRLIVRVESTCRFIENQQLWSSNKRSPRQGDPLTLAARQPAKSSVPQDSLQPIGKASHEYVRIRGLKRIPHRYRFPDASATASSEVGGYCVMQQEYILRHVGHVITPSAPIILIQGDSVDNDIPRRWLKCK